MNAKGECSVSYKRVRKPDVSANFIANFLLIMKRRDRQQRLVAGECEPVRRYRRLQIFCLSVELVCSVLPCSTGVSTLATTSVRLRSRTSVPSHWAGSW